MHLPGDPGALGRGRDLGLLVALDLEPLGPVLQRLHLLDPGPAQVAQRPGGHDGDTDGARGRDDRRREAVVEVAQRGQGGAEQPGAEPGLGGPARGMGSQRVDHHQRCDVGDQEVRDQEHLAATRRDHRRRPPAPGRAVASGRAARPSASRRGTKRPAPARRRPRAAARRRTTRPRRTPRRWRTRARAATSPIGRGDCPSASTLGSSPAEIVVPRRSRASSPV